MSSIPNISVTINLERGGVINLLLASVAFEELGLAHLINSEAEKIQFVLGTLSNQTEPVSPTLGNLISIDESVEKMLKLIAKNQMLLEFKLDEVPREFPNVHRNPTTTLAPGELFEVTTTEPWTAGQHTNNATVTGEYNGTIVTDTDPANYFGLAAPAIEVVKYVSVDNGMTWYDANTPPYPDLVFPIIPRYKFVVTNTGTVLLTNIQVTDDVLGLIGILPSLAPGSSFEWIVIAY